MNLTPASMQVQVPLPLLRYLDPRTREAALSVPLDSALNIPLDELADRVYELPPKSETVFVAGGLELTTEAVALLSSLGRRAEVVRGIPIAEKSAIGRLWRPNSFLEQVLPELNLGWGIDIGCGSGRDAIFMAMYGWRVMAIDRLPEAIDMGRRLAARYLPSREAVEFRVARAPSQLSGSYDLVTCFFMLDKAVLNGLRELLAPGGIALVETFTTMNREALGRPKSEARVLQPGELPTLVPGLDVEGFEEGWHDGRHTARLVARRR